MRNTYFAVRKMLAILLIVGTTMIGISFKLSTLTQAASTTPILDKYGGWMGKTIPNNTGHWIVECDSERYWFVTPDGHAMWIVGSQHCTPGPEWQGSNDLGYAPIALVNMAKYGWTANWKNAWVQSQLKRYQEWGFNSTLIMDDATNLDDVARFKLLDMNWITVPRVSDFFPDVFDPSYNVACLAKAEEVRSLANDKKVIGVYLGNEQTWMGHVAWPPSLTGLPNTFIALRSTASGKQYWVNTFLKGRYPTVTDLNVAYGTQFRSWDDLLQCTNLPDNATFPSIRADKCDFSEAIAEAYYKPLAAAVRAVAPKLLILSERLRPVESSYLPYLDYFERIWKVAGKYCDVFCINSYLDYTTLKVPGSDQLLVERMMQDSGKPILITEHSYLGDDTYVSDSSGIHQNVFQTDRAQFYIDYLNRMLTTHVAGTDGRIVNPFLGVVWHKWYDDPVGGSTQSSGEHCNFGLIDGQDEAYIPLTDAMTTANNQIYDAIASNRTVTMLNAPSLISPEFADTVPGLITFSWTPVSGVASYTLLISPEEAFPEVQTTRYDNINGTSFTIPSVLPNGMFYWSVRANGTSPRRGGYYSGPFRFRAKNTMAAPADALNLEQMDKVSFEGILDTDSRVLSYAILDKSLKNRGSASARMTFTYWSPWARLRNDASAYLDCAGTLGKWSGIQLSVYPTNFCDTTKALVPSSKYVSMRFFGTDGKVFYESPLDLSGTLKVGTWNPVAISFGVLVPNPQDVSKIAFTVFADQNGLACGQRLTINIDNIVPVMQVVKNYVVTFNKNDVTTGASTTTASVAAGGTATLPVTPKRTDYAFTGWNTESNGTGTAFIGSTIVAADITVYAQWSTAKVYTVIFSRNGGTVSATPSSRVTAAGGTVALPDKPPLKTNYAFFGWNTKYNGTGRMFTSDTPVTANITVYAQWHPNYCTVSFYRNGGTTSASPSSIKVAYGKAVKLPSPPKRTNYTFVGWNTRSNGTGSTFDAAKALTTNLIVYAQWRSNYCIVSFYRNGGTISAVPSSIRAAYGNTVTLPTPPKRTGYTFVGWNTRSTGKGTTFTANTSVTNSLIVYAQWHKD